MADCFALVANVRVAFQHRPADVPGQGSDRFLAYIRIFGKAGNESVTTIMPAILDFGDLACDLPCFLPLPDWLSEISSVELRATSVSL